METMTTRIISESEVPEEIRKCAGKSYKEISQIQEHTESSFKETIIEIISENRLSPEVVKCLIEAYCENDITKVMSESKLSWELLRHLVAAYLNEKSITGGEVADRPYSERGI